jgi:hypothetical protein
MAAGVTTAAIGVGIWAVYLRGQPGAADRSAPAEANRRPSGPVRVIGEPSRPPATPAPVPASTPAATQPTATRQEAKAAFDQGRALLAAGKSLAARPELSRAVFSGQLTPAEESQAVQDAAEAARKTLFSRELLDGDAYNLPYPVKAGETLEGPRGIEMTLGLHVPASLLLKVNGLSRGADMRPGQTLKLVQGPFHAVVYKGRFLMDVYLQREALEKVFIRRIPVGLGMNSSTPVGAWRVKKGEKMVRPKYNATPGSGLPAGTIVLYGQPGYPFGAKAMWIGLEGQDERTAGISDFGIHSTNDPNSVGKANSLGCVRMADDDIDWVFSLLYDVHSRVDVMP